MLPCDWVVDSVHEVACHGRRYEDLEPYAVVICDGLREGVVLLDGKNEKDLNGFVVCPVGVGIKKQLDDILRTGVWDEESTKYAIADEAGYLAVEFFVKLDLPLIAFYGFYSCCDKLVYVHNAPNEFVLGVALA